MKDKPKFNKEKCYTCIYHTTQVSGSYTIRKGKQVIPVACDYINVTGDSCFKNSKSGRYDMRGDDYNDCKLYRGEE